MHSNTRIRLIEPADSAPIAAHRVRDFEAFRPWEPAQPADFVTPEGQAERIDRLLAGYRAGSVWPGVPRQRPGDRAGHRRRHPAAAARAPRLRRILIASVARNQGHAGMLWERVLGD